MAWVISLFKYLPKELNTYRGKHGGGGHVLRLFHTSADSAVDCVNEEIGATQPLWPDWAIFWTLGKFLKPLAAINLPQSSPFLVNDCKGVKIIHFSSETIFHRHLAIFNWSHWTQPSNHVESADRSV